MKIVIKKKGKYIKILFEVQSTTLPCPDANLIFFPIKVEKHYKGQNKLS